MGGGVWRYKVQFSRHWAPPLALHTSCLSTAKVAGGGGTGAVAVRNSGRSSTLWWWSSYEAGMGRCEVRVVEQQRSGRT